MLESFSSPHSTLGLKTYQMIWKQLDSVMIN